MPNQSHRPLVLLSLFLAFGLVYVLAYSSSEPFYYYDETRHVMTGVYFRDLLHDMPFAHLREYTINYYLQYPALGLLIWPPFFYFLDGLAMSIFGMSIIVPKVLVGLFAVIACVYLFRLVRLSHDVTRAAIAVLFFGLSPLVFELSHYVMLELPALALGLAATYHFVAFLDKERRRDLVLAALFSVLAALTRFDGAHLVLLFLILILARKRWDILWRRDVLLAAALALLIIVPFYALSASQVGWLHFQSVTGTMAPPNSGFLFFRRLFFYPSILPGQLGLIPLILALIGLIFALTKRRREFSWPYLAIVITTYITFTPIGELDYRHTIYWIPAFVFFAADGLALIAEWMRLPQFYLPLAACVLIGMMWLTLSKPLPWIRGYEEAARAVASSSSNSPYCLFVGRLNGNFIYQLRRQDPQRRLWVLRADKLLFSVLNVPDIQYKQLAANDEEILAIIFKYDPEFIVMEEPAPWATQSTAPEEQLRSKFETQVRAAINGHPERFNLEKSSAVHSNMPEFQGMMLKIFRNIYRNKSPQRRLDLDILTLRRSFQTMVP